MKDFIKGVNDMSNELEQSVLYDESIILIGPSGAGKSTIAEELRKITGMRRLCLDGIANSDRRNGITRSFNGKDEYSFYLLQKVLRMAEEQGNPGIVDFGAGHSVFDDPVIFAQVKKMLIQFKNVILLLPSVDPKTSLQIMAERSTGDTSENKKFLTSPCNRELATMVVYGNGRTPEEIAKEIIERITAREMQHSLEETIVPEQ